MKFVKIASVLFASIGLTQADVGVACENPNDSECAPGECCGWASPASGSTASLRLKICQLETMLTYVNRHDATKFYDFVCAYDRNDDPQPVINEPSEVDTIAVAEEQG